MISPRTLLAAGQLLLLAVAAFLSANVVNVWIAARFQPHPAPAKSPLRAPEMPEAKRPLAYYAPITDRDIFNPPRPTQPGAQAPAGRLDVKLLGTAPSVGMDSYAIIADDESKPQMLYRVGDSVRGRVLSRVAWDHVVVSGPQGEEVLKIVDATRKPSATTPAQAPASAPAVDGGIEKRSDTDFVIDRSEVDKAMENLNELFTQIRAVPHFQDGKASGFRLFAIRQQSVFEKIGLKNGDIVTRINGNDLTDPARAMSLIQELRGEGRISVDVMRNRQPTSLSYEIR
jgi:general secretion pathway protein C